MPSKKGRTYTLYNRFRTNLDAACTQNEALEVFARMLPTFGADTAAILIQPNLQERILRVGPHVGEPELWSNYSALPPSDREALSRVLRLCIFPVSYSDMQNHGRMRFRLRTATILLSAQCYKDAFVIPLFDRIAGHTMMVAAGSTLSLSPRKQYWLVRAGSDIAARISQLNDGSLLGIPPLTPRVRPKLTPRQEEIAPWLVAGKSDWEIGQILEISEKTSNYHVENMKRAYGVKTRAQFVAAYVRDQGL